MLNENKLAPRNNTVGNNNEAKNTYLYQIIPIYNKLPKEITLLKSNVLFKKWIILYYSTERFKEPVMQWRPKSYSQMNIIDMTPINFEKAECVRSDVPITKTILHMRLITSTHVNFPCIPPDNLNH